MRIYSITDVTHLVQELLHNHRTFATIPVKKGVIDILQHDASGTISQRFRIKVENTPAEPI